MFRQASVQVPPAIVVAQFDVICPDVLAKVWAMSLFMHLCPAAFLAQDAKIALETVCMLQLLKTSITGPTHLASQNTSGNDVGLVRKEVMADAQSLGKLLRLLVKSQVCRGSIERLVSWLADFRRASRLTIAMPKHRTVVIIASTFIFAAQYLYER